MIGVYAAAGTFASKRDLAQQLAAAVMRRGQVPLIRIATPAFWTGESGVSAGRADIAGSRLAGAIHIERKST
jgi:hypothetical protein